jgi:hypothetical protein
MAVKLLPNSKLDDNLKLKILDELSTLVPEAYHYKVYQKLLKEEQLTMHSGKYLMMHHQSPKNHQSCLKFRAWNCCVVSYPRYEDRLGWVAGPMGQGQNWNTYQKQNPHIFEPNIFGRCSRPRHICLSDIVGKCIQKARLSAENDECKLSTNDNVVIFNYFDSKKTTISIFNNDNGILYDIPEDVQGYHLTVLLDTLRGNLQSDLCQIVASSKAMVISMKMFKPPKEVHCSPTPLKKTKKTALTSKLTNYDELRMKAQRWFSEAQLLPIKMDTIDGLTTQIAQKNKEIQILQDQLLQREGGQADKFEY